MDQIGTVVTFTFQMVSAFFTWCMSNWVTACFPVACVIAFVVNLVIASASGSDDNK